jgi:drug/metabolite transporter (DMT)-like permease
MQKGKKATVYLMLILAMVFWGLSFIWYKQACLSFSPTTIILFRLVLSIPLLFISWLIFGKFKLPEKKDLKFFFLLAFFEPFMYFLGESYGLLYISSILASIIISTIPLFIPFLAYYYYNERLERKNYIGIVVSFLGVLMLVLVDTNKGHVSVKGILLLFLAVFSAQGYTLVLRKLIVKYHPLLIVCFQNLFGVILFFPIFIILDFKSLTLSDFTFTSYLPIIYLSIFASSLAFVFFSLGVRHLGTAKTVVFTNFIPVVTTFFAVIMINEKMSFLRFAGIMVTISGLILSQVGHRHLTKYINRNRKNELYN